MAKPDTTTTIWSNFNQDLLKFISSRVRNLEIARDILQDVFIKIHNNLDQLKADEKITKWVYQITRNTIIDYYREQKIDISDYDFAKSLPKETEQEPADFTNCLKRFIAELPEQYRHIILQTTYSKISVKDYAAKYNLSYAAAKSRVQRARKKLKAKFIACCKIETDRYGNITAHACSKQTKDCQNQ